MEAVFSKVSINQWSWENPIIIYKFYKNQIVMKTSRCKKGPLFSGHSQIVY